MTGEQAMVGPRVSPRGGGGCDVVVRGRLSGPRPFRQTLKTKNHFDTQSKLLEGGRERSAVEHTLQGSEYANARGFIEAAGGAVVTCGGKACVAGGVTSIGRPARVSPLPPHWNLRQDETSEWGGC
jgi:hypothetical protein